MAGQLNINTPWRLGEACALLAVEELVQVETLAGNATLTAAYPSIVKFDPGGSARDVTLDAEPTNNGLVRLIVNAADAAENLVVKDDSPTTIATLNQNEAGLFFCDGSAWILVFVFSIALS